MNPRKSLFLTSLLVAVHATVAHAQYTEPDATLVDTLDPSFQERFGAIVEVSGNFAFCHSVGDVNQPGFSPGSVHIFERKPAGWEFVQRLRPFRPTTGGSIWAFGRAMLAFEDRLIVGALAASVPEPASGLVVCYRRINGRYEMEQIISDGPGYAQAYNLGRAMAMHEGDLFVSAAGADLPGTTSHGKILRFEEVGGQWFFAEEIIPATGGFTRAGTGLCFDEGRLIVTVQSWYALVFQRQGGQWVQTQMFGRQFHPDVYGCVGGGGWVHFADADVSGNGFGIGHGDVTEFRWDGTEYVYQRRIFASDAMSAGNIGDRFGYSIDRDGDRMVVGARSATIDGIHREGSAYILELIGGQWVETERLIPSQAGVPGEAYAGVSVALQDDTIIVGSSFFDLAGDGQVNAGAAFIYERPFGSEVCQGLINSTGLPGTLEVFGNRTAAAGTVRLEASQLPPNSFSLFFAGRSAGFTSMPAGSSGNLCIAGSAGRFGASQASPGGAATWTVNTSTLPPQIGGALQPGDTLVFQTWYRDANPTVTSNFTGAVEVTFD